MIIQESIKEAKDCRKLTENDVTNVGESKRNSKCFNDHEINILRNSWKTGNEEPLEIDHTPDEIVGNDQVFQDGNFKNSNDDIGRLEDFLETNAKFQSLEVCDADEFHSIQGDVLTNIVKPITPADDVEKLEAKYDNHPSIVSIQNDQTEKISISRDQNECLVASADLGFIECQSLKQKVITNNSISSEETHLTSTNAITDISDNRLKQSNPHGSDCQISDHHNLEITCTNSEDRVAKSSDTGFEMGRASRKSRDANRSRDDNLDAQSHESNDVSPLSNSIEQIKNSQSHEKIPSPKEEERELQSHSMDTFDPVKDINSHQMSQESLSSTNEPLMLGQFLMNQHKEWCPCLIVITKQKVQASFAARGSKNQDHCTMSTLRIPYSNVTCINSGDEVQDDLYGRLFGLEITCKAGTFTLGFSTESKRDEYFHHIQDLYQQSHKRSLPGCFQFVSFLLRPCRSNKYAESNEITEKKCCDKSTPEDSAIPDS